MRTIITVSKNKAMRGRWKVSAKHSNSRFPEEFDLLSSEDEVAAKAVECALFSESGAVITAPKSILELIPKELGGLK